MSLSAPLLIVAALVFPQLGDRFHAYVTTDRVGEAHLELFIAPDGAVDECTILYTDFNAEVDVRLCNQARQKTAETPAQDQDGQAVYGTAIFTFRTTNGFRPEAQSILRREPVLELTVERLPASVDRALVVGLRVMVSAEGQVEACDADTRLPDGFTRAACAQLQAITHPVRRSLEGEPVRYLTDMTVMFSAG